MSTKEIFSHAIVGICAALITLAAIGASIAWAAIYQPQLIDSVLSIVYQDSVDTQPYGADAREEQVVEAVKKANPAVVAITVSVNVPVYERYYESAPFGDSFFFRIPALRQSGTELQEVGGGSGFLVSEDGYIVTNRHVVSDENAAYTVFTNDGKSYPATVIARDNALDIAIIKIEGTGFDHLTFADSDVLEVGQTAIAIGNALAEFRNTVSVGVVSGLSRSIVASDRSGSVEALDQLIQTDAAINSGNSGGPLLNLNGEVIGVNVAIVSGAQNVGFALSSNSVKNIVASVKETGRIVRPYIGVRYVPITPELQEMHDLPVAYGVLVRRGRGNDNSAVIDGSPADRAGIQEGDIILEVDGVQINQEHTLSAAVSAKKVGESVTLTLLRNDTQEEVNLTLEELSL